MIGKRYGRENSVRNKDAVTLSGQSNGDAFPVQLEFGSGSGSPLSLYYFACWENVQCVKIQRDTQFEIGAYPSPTVLRCLRV